MRIRDGGGKGVGHGGFYMVCLELGAGSVRVDVNCEGCAGEAAVAGAVAVADGEV